MRRSPPGLDKRIGRCILTRRRSAGTRRTRRTRRRKTYLLLSNCAAPILSNLLGQCWTGWIDTPLVCHSNWSCVLTAIQPPVAQTLSNCQLLLHISAISAILVILVILVILATTRAHHVAMWYHIVYHTQCGTTQCTCGATHVRGRTSSLLTFIFKFKHNWTLPPLEIWLIFH